MQCLPQARPEGEEVPLGAGRLQHCLGVDAQAIEDDRQFVHQRDVEVALGVLDHLGRLGHADARRAVGAGGDDLGVERVHPLGDLGVDPEVTHDRSDTVLLVTRVDPLGAVAREEVLVEAQTRDALQHRNAVLLGRPRVDGGLVERGRRASDLAEGLARTQERSQVRYLCSSMGVGTVTM